MLAGGHDGVAPRGRAADRSLRRDVTQALDGKSEAPVGYQGKANVIGSGVRDDSNQSLGSASCENSGQALASRSRRLIRARAMRLFTVPTLSPSACAISS
jgi:hypothetical protein